ncbi:FtsX-like permease family protein, partial [Bacillus sp. JJ722]|uniref:FtsX-like permease family protein n=1 Tax=Bacillus sp. JJ722 TaxID=3122973 RepID=UPI002FFFD1B2
MIKVRNKKIINHISIEIFKKNKIRNLFIVLAIILTTFTITSVFSIGISYYESVKQQRIMMQGSKFDAMLLSPTNKQIDIARNMENTKYIGLYAKAGSVKKYQNENTRLPMVWIDDSNWNHQVKPSLEKIVGHYPQKVNEVMLSEVSLKKLGIKKEHIGMKLPFQYENENGLHEKTFILTGYYKDYTTSPKVYVSKEFYSQSGYKLDDVNIGKMYLTFKNPLLSENQINQLKNDFHISKKQELYTDPDVISIFYGVVLGIGGLSLLIMISGYLLIYNVLSISISKEIHFYGLLNSIGTTSKQIKRLVKRQVAFLSILGIPIGLTLGAVISLGFVPFVLGAFSVETLKVQVISFHPIIFVGAALFSFIAVLLGTNKPAKMASNITSIESMKYNESSNTKNKKNSTSGGKLYRMAWRNMFRYRKRAIIVFLSLFIGMTTFMTVNTMANSQGVRNILSSFISYDISLSNESITNEDEQKIKQIFNDDFIEQVESLDGVKEVHNITVNKLMIAYNEEILGDYLKEFYNKQMREPYNEEVVKRFKEHPEEFYGFAIGIDETYFDELNKTLDHPINKADFLSGKTGIIEKVNFLDVNMDN